MCIFRKRRKVFNFDPNEVIKGIKGIKGYLGYLGYRVKQKDNFIKRFSDFVRFWDCVSRLGVRFRDYVTFTKDNFRGRFRDFSLSSINWHHCQRT